MSEQFKRERRYVITKIGKPDWNKTCVVVEEGWPEYEIVWKMIQDRMEGRPNQLVEALAKIEAADGQEPAACLFSDAEGNDDCGTNITAINKFKQYRGGSPIPLFTSPQDWFKEHDAEKDEKIAGMTALHQQAIEQLKSYEQLFKDATLAVEAARIPEDTARLDFILNTVSFISVTKTDVGGEALQLIMQNEDEEFICLHDPDSYFKTDREAIDAAMLAAAPNPTD